jgi:hypothetical protein
VVGGEARVFVRIIEETVRQVRRPQGRFAFLGIQRAPGRPLGAAEGHVDVRAKLRVELPSICPKVCDPFKNRANTMLQLGKTIIAEHGLDHLERDVTDLIGARTYDTAHGRHQNR